MVLLFGIRLQEFTKKIDLNLYDESQSLESKATLKIKYLYR